MEISNSNHLLNRIIPYLKLGPFTFMVVVGPEYLNHNIASSLALYTYLARCVDKCKAESMEFFMSSLDKVVLRVLSSIEDRGSTVDLGTGSIVIHRDGQAAGFKECLSSVGVHVAVQELLKKEPWPTKIIFNFWRPSPGPTPTICKWNSTLRCILIIWFSYM